MFLIFTPKIAFFLIQFDEHIFQMGWNHQPATSYDQKAVGMNISTHVFEWWLRISPRISPWFDSCGPGLLSRLPGP